MKTAHVIACGVLAAAIGPVALSATPDPAIEKSVVPPVIYRSPFHDYRGLGEDKLIPWKQANDEVGRIGGWRVYAREARDPAIPATSSPQATPSPAEAPADKPLKREPGRDQHEHRQ